MRMTSRAREASSKKNSLKVRGRSGSGVGTSPIVVKLDTDVIGHHQVVLEEVYSHDTIPKSGQRPKFGRGATRG